MKRLLALALLSIPLAAQTAINVFPSPAGTPGGAVIGEINFYDLAATNSIALQAPGTLGANYVLTLPAPTGSAGCVSISAVGVMGVAACSGGMLTPPVTISGSTSGPLVTFTQSGTGPSLLISSVGDPGGIQFGTSSTSPLLYSPSGAANVIVLQPVGGNTYTELVVAPSGSGTSGNIVVANSSNASNFAAASLGLTGSGNTINFNTTNVGTPGTTITTMNIGESGSASSLTTINFQFGGITQTSITSTTGLITNNGFTICGGTTCPTYDPLGMIIAVNTSYNSWAVNGSGSSGDSTICDHIGCEGDFIRIKGGNGSSGNYFDMTRVLADNSGVLPQNQLSWLRDSSAEDIVHITETAYATTTYIDLAGELRFGLCVSTVVSCAGYATDVGLTRITGGGRIEANNGTPTASGGSLVPINAYGFQGNLFEINNGSDYFIWSNLSLGTHHFEMLDSSANDILDYNTGGGAYTAALWTFPGSFSMKNLTLSGTCSGCPGTTYSGGTGVTIAGAVISIGQAVATTSSPTFAGETENGNLMPGSNNAYNLGSNSVAWESLYLGTGLQTPLVKLYNGTDYFTWFNSGLGAHHFEIIDSSADNILDYNTGGGAYTAATWTFAANVTANAVTGTAGLITGSSAISTIYIGSTGNFFNRDTGGASTLLSCSGVANGWTAVTTDDYFVVCIGSSRYRAALVSF
jgi:hypothetical protein